MWPPERPERSAFQPARRCTPGAAGADTALRRQPCRVSHRQQRRQHTCYCRSSGLACKCSSFHLREGFGPFPRMPFLPSFIFFNNFIFRERGSEKEERNPCTRDTVHQLPLARPQLGIWPVTQASALTVNPISPLSHTNQGASLVLRSALSDSCLPGVC